MSYGRNIKLGEILLEKKWIDSKSLDEALHRQKTERKFLGSILLADKKITEEQLAQALSEQFQIPYIQIRDFYVDWKMVMRFSASLILDYKCFPLSKDGRIVTFAITNILDGWVRAQIEKEAQGYEVQLAFVTYSDMRELLERFRQYVNIQTRRLLD